MSAIESETSSFSLADLANLDTTEIQTLMSRLPDEGIFIVRGTSVAAGMNEPKEDKPPLMYVAFEVEILEAKPHDKTKDPESYVGKTLKERYTLWPDQFQELVGLLKGRYKTVNLPNEGRFGGVDGQEPGWVDGIVNHIFSVRVRHWTSNKSGQTNAQFDWLPYETEDSGNEEEQVA